jgi:hypothetical protein
MPNVRRLAEQLARSTSRRGLISRGAGAVTWLLMGTAAGATGWRIARAGVGSSCVFPKGMPCACAECRSSGACAKPCTFATFGYASGCWVSLEGATCCDCTCPTATGFRDCGCGTDYYTAFCP